MSYKPIFPDVQQRRAAIDANKERLRSEIERIVESETVSVNPARQQLILASLTLDAHRQGLQAQQQVQSAAADIAQRDKDGLAAKLVGFQGLSADETAATDVADQLRVSVQHLDALRNTETALGGTRIRIIERAAIPDEQNPDSPKAVIDLVAGLVAGVVLAIAVALLADYWRAEPVGLGREDEPEPEDAVQDVNQ